VTSQRKESVAGVTANEMLIIILRGRKAGCAEVELLARSALSRKLSGQALEKRVPPRGAKPNQHLDEKVRSRKATIIEDKKTTIHSRQGSSPPPVVLLMARGKEP